MPHGPEFEITQTNQSAELTTLLSRLIRSNVRSVAEIAGSLVRGKPRDFTADCERLAASIEPANILGKKHIPLTSDPIIIACNHPDIYDLVSATIHITSEVSKSRKEHALPGDIHWLIADNLPLSAVAHFKRPNLSYAMLNKAFKKLHKSYGENFIPVPMDTNSDTQQARGAERIQAIKTALQVFRNSNGSRIVGIYPEGDFSQEGTLNKFYKGVGVLAKSVFSDGVSIPTIVPTGIYRDKDNRLTIKFGEALGINREETAAAITEKVRNAISQVSGFRL